MTPLICVCLSTFTAAIMLKQTHNKEILLGTNLHILVFATTYFAKKQQTVKYQMKIVNVFLPYSFTAYQACKCTNYLRYLKGVAHTIH